MRQLTDSALYFIKKFKNNRENAVAFLRMRAAQRLQEFQKVYGEDSGLPCEEAWHDLDIAKEIQSTIK